MFRHRSIKTRSRRGNIIFFFSLRRGCRLVKSSMYDESESEEPLDYKIPKRSFLSSSSIFNELILFFNLPGVLGKSA
jgi:hypothetical protein